MMVEIPYVGQDSDREGLVSKQAKLTGSLVSWQAKQRVSLVSKQAY